MSDTISRKGVFIPDITVEMFRNASLESIEDLMASGEMEDILLPSAQPKQRIPQMRGWVCPVCGRGLSPYTSVCPCNNGKGWELTC